MTELASLMLRGEAVTAFDGTKVVRGPAPATELLRRVDALAVADVAAAEQWLRRHLGAAHGVEVIDVPALMRSDGFSDDEGEILRHATTSPAEAQTSLATALLAIGSRPQAPHERSVLSFTGRKNAEGLRIDRARAAELAVLFRDLRDTKRAELRRALPVSDPDIRGEAAFRAALAARFPGLRIESTKIGSSAGLVGEVVNARQAFLEFSKAASRMRELAEGQEHVRDFLKFFGAHTGRFTTPGLGLHSLPKDPQPILRSLSRQRETILPREGRWFAARDLNAIEVRVLAFLAGEDELVARLRSPEDIYSWYAGVVWPGAMVEKNGVNTHLRAIAKEAMLSLGFGVGENTFARRVRARMSTATAADLARAFHTYRSRFLAIARAHNDALRIVLRAVEGAGDIGRILMCNVERHGNALAVTLPSSRRMYYRNLRVSQDEHGDHALWYSGSTPTSAGRTSVPFIERYAKEHRFDDGIVRYKLPPHALVQNIVQATARDLIVHMQARLIETDLTAIDFSVAFSVHDALVAECAGTDAAWDDAQAVLTEVMGEVPDSLPALRSLPLASAVEAGPRERYG